MNRLAASISSIPFQTLHTICAVDDQRVLRARVGKASTVARYVGRPYRYVPTYVKLSPIITHNVLHSRLGVWWVAAYSC